ncbi:MAG: M48 family metallopeptidase [Betaproteobacteria bacterium]|nr:M48 family metallopeptidase [Betaproteobacteria bacterium]MCL2886345.1 M48 family metallopeptidase [Betaproteobacteria bacterium]
MNHIAANFFDGRTPRRQAVELLAEGEEIVIRGAFGELRAPRAQVEISEPLGKAPRRLRLPDGAVCEIADHSAFAAWLAAAGFAESPVVRLQARWSWAVAALAGTLLAVLAAYFWGLPAASKALAPHIPAPVVRSLSEYTLNFLDERLLHPSQLPPARQEELRSHIADVLRAQPGQPAYRLHFRSGPMPNAFALPNGDLVMFDELVALAESDDEVAGVAAHELGHVAYHHGLRQLIQSSVVSFVAALYLGDVSSIASALAALALESRYSRDFELEADAYAAKAMTAAGRSAEPLALMLERLDGGRGGAVAEALSTHPDSADRIRRLRTGQPGG